MPAYFDEKRKTWYAKFNYKDENGDTRFTTKRGFETEEEALEYEREFKLYMANDLKMKFRDFVKIYRKKKYPEVRKSTISTKDHVIETKILPYFGNYEVRRIRETDIVEWLEILREHRDARTGAPYSDMYLKTVCYQMRAIMNFAVKEYHLIENPVKTAGLFVEKKSDEVQFWTLNEYLQFADCIKEDRKLFTCFEVLYWCGLREGELLALVPGDIDLASKTISVTKTHQVVSGRKVVGPPRTGAGTRIVTMPDRVCKEIEFYFENYLDRRRNNLFALSKKSLISGMTLGAEKAGVRKINIQDLRHSQVHLLAKLGCNATDIADRLGVESKTIMKRYAHMFPHVQQIESKLNALIDAL